MNPWVQILLAIIAAGGASAIAALFVRKKTDAESADLISAAAVRLVGATEKREASLSARLDLLEAANRDLEYRVAAAENQAYADKVKIAKLERQVSWLRARLTTAIIAEFDSLNPQGDAA